MNTDLQDVDIISLAAEEVERKREGMVLCRENIRATSQSLICILPVLQLELKQASSCVGNMHTELHRGKQKKTEPKITREKKSRSAKSCLRGRISSNWDPKLSQKARNSRISEGTEIHETD